MTEQQTQEKPHIFRKVGEYFIRVMLLRLQERSEIGGYELMPHAWLELKELAKVFLVETDDHTNTDDIVEYHLYHRAHGRDVWELWLDVKTHDPKSSEAVFQMYATPIASMPLRGLFDAWFESTNTAKPDEASIAEILTWMEGRSICLREGRPNVEQTT